MRRIFRAQPLRRLGMALLLVAPGAAAIAAAQTLDAGAAKTQIVNRTWEQQAAHGPGKVYWTWESGGSVCLRTDGPKGKCSDTGKWTLEDNRMC